MLTATWVAAVALAAEPGPAGGVQEIGTGWQAEGLRRLPVAEVQASSEYAPDSGQYRPEHAVDGNRGSKWVACVAPSRAAPQWLVLRLVGTPEVSALALFGEAVGNNGVLEAEVQVAATPDGEFRTVAAVTDARWRSWLVHFPPTPAAAARLLIIRSDVAACPHTDVYEVELYGRPLEAYAAADLRACAVALHEAVAVDLAAARALTPGEDTPEAAACRRIVTHLAARVEPCQARLGAWDTLDAAARVALVRDLEALGPAARVTSRFLGPAQAGGAPRARAMATLRAAAVVVAAGQDPDRVTATRDGRRLRLGNRWVTLCVDEDAPAWDAVWPTAPDAAVSRVGFRVVADGRELGGAGAPAEVRACTDALGPGLEVRQAWGEGVVVERSLRLLDGQAAVVVGGRIVNRLDRPVALSGAGLLDLDGQAGGWWQAGSRLETPAVVAYPPAANPCQPWAEPGVGFGAQASAAGTGVLTLASRQPPVALTCGLLSAVEGAPSVRAAFRPGQGGTGLRASLDYGGRVLAPGQSVPLDSAWLSVDADGLAALERYGSAVATLAPQPLRLEANSLWCSWYPIRMGIAEDNVLQIAGIAATHFRPLGLDVIQLDHGWQRGDVCGDWVANERFPHGLKWLADQLRERFGMRLGLWIAPTVVAETSELFREHPEWLFTGADGQPTAIYRWYWKPNPQCYSLDSTNPGAGAWLEQTFARLRADGAVYYKIDFPGGGPGRPADPACVPGWGVLRRTAAAIRRGAGPDAWVRYCQTPPLIAAGLADSAYLGQDTGDAGLAWQQTYLDENAQLLAASFWANGRLYRREICDMSVGLKADLEEARIRLAAMTLAGCSISFSDDFRLLDLPRIRLLQTCLPPGAPAAMRPLDLFERRTPSLWHVPCRRGDDVWHVVGLFNFDDTPQARRLDLARLGLAPGARVTGLEFWEQRWLGVLADSVTLSLPPHSSRVLALRPLADRPQVVGTDMHLFQGWHELDAVAWDPMANRLSGLCRRAPGLSGRVLVRVPPDYRPAAAADGPTRPTPVGDDLWAVPVEFGTAQVPWSVRFEHTGR